MAIEPYRGVVMKMTMHIDEDVLDRVMKITGAKTKTAAVEIALKDMARRHKLKEIFSAGLGLTPAQLKAEFASDTPGVSDFPAGGLMVSEAPASYGEPRPPGQ